MNGTGVCTQNFTHLRNYDYEAVCGASNSEFPAEYEIPRENTGFLRDQKFEDCVANVIAQLSEAFWNKELGMNEKHSEQFAYGALRKETSRGTGMIVSTAMDYWNKIGIVPQKYFDVGSEMPEIMEIVKKYPDVYEIAKKYRISGYVQLKGEAQVKDALMKYNCGLLAVSPSGFSVGSHCIMITGWNDNTKKYKIKNSWGDRYGDCGYGELLKSKINAIYMPIFDEVSLPFYDVKESDWYYKSVRNMVFAGMMNGTSENTFEPDRPMTRAEVATMFDRLMKNIDERFDLLDRILEEKENL